MPRLWQQTIAAHREGVQDAILETTAGLVARHGLRGVTMSQIAEEAGIGRATLYKYFPNVDTILLAWHARHVAHHLEHLTHLRNQAGDAEGRLRAVLEAYAQIAYERHQHAVDIRILAHRGQHFAAPHAQVTRLVEDLLAECGEAGAVRTDIPPSELAPFCVQTLDAAGAMPSPAAAARLVALVLSAIQPAPGGAEGSRLMRGVISD